MRIHRLVALLLFVASACVSLGQTLPPPAFAGQSYWYGPGPQGYSVMSSTQDSGGYAEFTHGSSGFAGTGGGPAFDQITTSPTQISAFFNVTTNVAIEPYVYVDGYFGISASVSGYSSTGSLAIGSSKFYMLHNVDVGLYVHDMTVLNLGDNPSGPVISCDYVVFAHAYSSGSYSSSFSISGGSDAAFSDTIPAENDGGILEVQISRSVQWSGPALAGNYVGHGFVQVTVL